MPTYTTTTENLLPSFTINLYPIGDEPRRSYPTPSLKHKGPLAVHCSFENIIHGIFVPDRGLHSIIYLNFGFDKLKPGIRIKSTQISLGFRGITYEAARPVMLGITPFTPESKTKTDSTQAIASAAVDLGEAFSDAETKSKVTLTELIGQSGYETETPNRAYWTLIENKTEKCGIPQHIKFGVILRRPNEGRFQCALHVSVKVEENNSLTEIEWVLESQPNEQHVVVFDPTLAPTAAWKVYDTKAWVLE